MNFRLKLEINLEVGQGLLLFSFLTLKENLI